MTDKRCCLWFGEAIIVNAYRSENGGVLYLQMGEPSYKNNRHPESMGWQWGLASARQINNANRK